MARQLLITTGYLTKTVIPISLKSDKNQLTVHADYRRASYNGDVKSSRWRLCFRYAMHADMKKVTPYI